MRNNNALISSFLSLLLALTLLLYTAGSTAFSVGEDITNAFTDPNFLAAVRDKINKPSGPIYEEDLLGITTLSVTGLNISSLAGIEYFVDLSTLYCFRNLLTELDLPKNAALTYLDCCSNQLTGLNISNNTVLKQLKCYGNLLTELDLHKNTELTQLLCFNNLLTELDLHNNTALNQLGCHNNRLTKLDVTYNTSLTILDCNYNDMNTPDDVSGLEQTKLRIDSKLFVFYPQNGHTNALIPVITKQPQTMTTVGKGGRVTLSVAAEVEQGTLSYQWFHSTVFEPIFIAGANESSYNPPTDALSSTRQYYCMVTNTDDTATGLKTASVNSDWAFIVVIEPTTYSGAVLYQNSSYPATIELYDSEDNPISTTITATDGAYQLSLPTALAAPAEETYTLVVTKPGYLSYTIKNLTLTEDEDIPIVDIRQLAGDIDGDGVINATDLTLLLSEFNRNPADSAYPYADIDGNGIVNATDLTYLLAGFNKHDVEIIM